jgi:hypothetical protein
VKINLKEGKICFGSQLSEVSLHDLITLDLSQGQTNIMLESAWCCKAAHGLAAGTQRERKLAPGDKIHPSTSHSQ